MVGIQIMKEKFYEKLTFSFLNDSKNKTSMSKEDYDALIARLLQLQNNQNAVKEKRDYHLCKRFDILEINFEGQQIQRLVKKKPKKNCF